MTNHITDDRKCLESLIQSADTKTAYTQPRSDIINYIKEKGYHVGCYKNKYGRREIVENTIYRYKSIIGTKLRSRKWDNQDAETLLGCHILNIMTNLHMPQSVKLT
nr:hypothetical protein [Candidatus Jidaibacter acanthamoeba]